MKKLTLFLLVIPCFAQNPGPPSGSGSSVNVTNFPATQPVSGTVTASISNFPGTQPVSGTVAATQSGSWADTVTGAAANGSAVSGNPVLLGGSDGTDARTLKTDTSGQLNINVVNNATVVGAAASGSAVSGNPVLMAGSDGTDARVIATSVGGVVDVATTENGVDGVNNSLGARLYAGATNFGQTEVRPNLYNGSTWDRQYIFPSSVSVNVTSATTTQLVALSGSTIIRVGAITLIDAVAATVQLEYGTGTACGTGTTALTGPMSLAANTPLTIHLGSDAALRTAAGAALCVVTGSGTTGLAGFISYAQF